jgi:hypothetical protein
MRRLLLQACVRRCGEGGQFDHFSYHSAFREGDDEECSDEPHGDEGDGDEGEEEPFKRAPTCETVYCAGCTRGVKWCEDCRAWCADYRAQSR